MRYLLDALYLLVFPIAVVFRLSRKRRLGLWDRFLGRTHSAFRIPHSAFPRVWFHGVSVGEIHLLRGIVREFRARQPHWHCIISSTTDTGFTEAQKWFPNLPVIRWPLDFSWAVERALAEVRPDLVVLAESEFWPNFLLAARRRAIPVVAVNVRLSPRSFRRYRLFRSLAVRWFRLLSHLAVQTQEYAEQLRQLGVPGERITVTGSVKYDGVRTERDNPKTAAFRELFGIRPAGLEDSPRGLVWVAGSTQAPEDEVVLRIFEKLQPEFPQLRLILVPRQPDQFEGVAQLIQRSGIPFIRRSQLPRSQALPRTALPRGSASRFASPSPPASGGEGLSEGGQRLPSAASLPPSPPSPLPPGERGEKPPHPHPLSPEAGERGEVAANRGGPPPVVLVDSLGELSAIWGLADVAFVGGSLDGQRGGQNMIEPAAYGAAVVFGPHVWNFRDTVERLLLANAALQIQDGEELEAVVRRLLADSEERQRLGEAARRLVLDQQGATGRTMEVLEKIMHPSPLGGEGMGVRGEDVASAAVLTPHPNPLPPGEREEEKQPLPQGERAKVAYPFSAARAR